MKSVFESPESMESYAIIDFCNLEISKIFKRLRQSKKLTPIERMIDIATGNNDKELIDNISELISLVEQKVDAKKFINADIDVDLELLFKLNESLIKLKAE